MRRLRGFLIGLRRWTEWSRATVDYRRLTRGHPEANAARAGVYGTPYRFQFTATGGLLPLTWKVTLGAVPPGLTLGANGSLTGAPTTRTGSPVFPAIGAIGLLLLTACGRGGGLC
jgi:hypothetical protein